MVKKADVLEPISTLLLQAGPTRVQSLPDAAQRRTNSLHRKILLDLTDGM